MLLCLVGLEKDGGVRVVDGIWMVVSVCLCDKVKECWMGCGGYCFLFLKVGV